MTTSAPAAPAMPPLPFSILKELTPSQAVIIQAGQKSLSNLKKGR